jgi:hypothetical protein
MKSKTKLLLIGLMLVGLSGCAQYIWRHGQFNQAAWNRDSYECERDMRQSAYFGGGLAGAIAAGEFQERCLIAKGYWKEKVEERKPAAQEPPIAAIGNAVY